jgi:hypothetical protein
LRISAAAWQSRKACPSFALRDVIWRLRENPLINQERLAPTVRGAVTDIDLRQAVVSGHFERDEQIIARFDPAECTRVLRGAVRVP